MSFRTLIFDLNLLKMLTISCRTIKTKSALIINFHTRPLIEDSSIKQETRGNGNTCRVVAICFIKVLWRLPLMLLFLSLKNEISMLTLKRPEQLQDDYNSNTFVLFSISGVSDTNHQCFPSSHFLRKAPTRISSSGVNEEKRGRK